MQKDRIRVRVDLFKRVILEQEKIRRMALTSQVISLISLAIAIGAMIIANTL